MLGYAGAEAPAESSKRATTNRARVNWEALEKRIGESESAYQRPVIRRKIDELVSYYRDCKDAGTLPAIPGAVIITSEKRFTFTPMASQHDLGLLQIPEEHGVLRVLDGQHRLLALHALTQAGENMGIEVPAVLFDRLDARQPVWAPFYTIHKIMAGLFDMYQLTDNKDALKVVEGMAGWADQWSVPTRSSFRADS